MNCESNVSLTSLEHCSGLLISVLQAFENQQHHQSYNTAVGRLSRPLKHLKPTASQLVLDFVTLLLSA
ncbi:hypothetical protein APTSU1_001018400 [Apodemus speciosus]|uniref:Uncharacterized protein n=1 Tax=Apodemus speciosus TaxID=105296 RepID=A0ABQ0F757_APOSI